MPRSTSQSVSHRRGCSRRCCSSPSADDASAEYACGTYPRAAEDGWVVMSILRGCRGLPRAEGRGQRDMVCQYGEVSLGGLGPAVSREDVGAPCVGGGLALCPGVLRQNAVDAL